MGFFSGSKKELGSVFIHRDDGVFAYKQFEIKDSSLCEYTPNGVMIRAYSLYFKLQKRFDGFKKMIKPGPVTVLYNRDIILDPFGQLVNIDKPEQGPQLVKKFTSRIATAKIYVHEKEQKDSWLFNKAVLFVGITMILLALIKGVQVVLMR